MRPKSVVSASLHVCFLLLFLCLIPLTISKPSFSTQEFKAQPSAVHYFEDSDVVLVSVLESGTVWRSTDGGMDWKMLDDRDGVVPDQMFGVLMSPASNKVAVILGTRGTHWVTKDQGKSWKGFKTEGDPDLQWPLSFHGTDADKIIVNVRKGRNSGASYYTTNLFEDVKPLAENSKQCVWAREKSEFDSEHPESNQRRILCIVEGRYSSRAEANRLLISDDYKFGDHAEEPDLEDGRTVTGIVSMVSAKSYIMAARKSEGSDELAVYTTKDTKTWHRALFGHQKIEADAYTVMESRNYSIQVDVMTGPVEKSMGMLYASNSNGTDFTRIEGYTNRNRFGIVDFENVQSVQGIVLVNIVDNHEAVLERDADKKVISQISFNDGRDFNNLLHKGDPLHLHNMADSRNMGRVFSSPAPGILMGVGNTGDYLHDYEEGDLFVSDDAGVTWSEALKGAHMYEFGDAGSLLVAVYNEAPTDKIMYSINHGKKWEAFSLDGLKFVPQILTTVPDSTSRKFVMLGKTGRGADEKHLVLTVNFEGLDLRKCKEDDFEKWQPKDKDDKARCVMGHKQVFKRRKADAECFIKNDFHEPFPDNSEECACRREDFECAYGFYKEKGECEPTGVIRPSEDVCKKPGDTFEGPPRYRLIPGDTCDKELGDALDRKKGEYSCNGTTTGPPANGEPNSTKNKFDAKGFVQALYLEAAETASDSDEEVIVGLTDEYKVYITRDHGKKWDQILKDDDIKAIYKNTYFNNNVYFVTSGDTVFYSLDRGRSIHEFKAPSSPNTKGYPALRFHEKNDKWLIWTGCEKEGSSKKCTPMAWASTKNGDEWTSLRKAVENCEFIYRQGSDRKEELIFCELHPDQGDDSAKQLVSSEDWFNHDEVKFEDMIRFATMSEYIVVAAKDEKDKENLRLDASIDARQFAHARFPSNFQVPHYTSYTVLDSSTHSIFLHVTVNEEADREYGSIVKSNSNGTYFTKAIENVNRNQIGYVDFDKMLGLEGVAIINIVANKDEVDEGAFKKLKTMITHSDGAVWDYIKPPAKDAEGKNYDCQWNPDEGKRGDCSLHLHGYTERDDPRDTYSSPSAVGLMIGVGNVGKYLGSKREANTFISTDGGVSWKTAMNGEFMWEYGDQGSLIVLVEKRTSTDRIFYSTDEGSKWREYIFSDSKMKIDDITTVPSDTSRNFLLWSSHDAATVNIDFSTLTDKKCEMDKENAGSRESDYYLWIPEHPQHPEKCLFGHQTQYQRKKPDRDCYNGPIKIDRFYDTIIKNCSCVRADFECNFNYEKSNSGDCVEVPGFKPPSDKEAEEYWCSQENAFQWWETTPYRKLEMSTCIDGVALDKRRSHPCSGKEPEYNEKYGVSKAAIFFAVVIPLTIALAAGYWVWKRWSHGKLGQIRLGDGPVGSAMSRGASSGGNMLLQIPVIIISGLAAAAMAVPMIVGSVWRWGRDRVGGRGGRYGNLTVGGNPATNFRGTGRTYRSRSSFARGRGDYAAVGGEDESDLLGEDSEDEV